MGGAVPKGVDASDRADNQNVVEDLTTRDETILGGVSGGFGDGGKGTSNYSSRDCVVGAPHGKSASFFGGPRHTGGGVVGEHLLNRKI